MSGIAIPLRAPRPHAARPLWPWYVAISVSVSIFTMIGGELAIDYSRTDRAYDDALDASRSAVRHLGDPSSWIPVDETRRSLFENGNFHDVSGLNGRMPAELRLPDGRTGIALVGRSGGFIQRGPDAEAFRVFLCPNGDTVNPACLQYRPAALASR